MYISPTKISVSFLHLYLRRFTIIFCYTMPTFLLTNLKLYLYIEFHFTCFVHAEIEPFQHRFISESNNHFKKKSSNSSDTAEILKMFYHADFLFVFLHLFSPGDIFVLISPFDTPSNIILQVGRNSLLSVKTFDIVILKVAEHRINLLVNPTWPLHRSYYLKNELKSEN